MKRFLSPFILVFTLILAGATSYIALRLGSHLAHWVLTAAAAVLLWLLPAVHWTSDADHSTKWDIGLQQASFVAMALLSWLFVITVARDLALLAAKLVGHPMQFPRGTPAYALAATLTAWGAWRAFRGPRIKEVAIPVEGLPEALDGFKIAQITDLHVGPTIGRDYVERLVGKVREIAPDATVLTGDIVDGNLADLRDAVAPLAKLLPHGKVYYVPGNHEYYWTIQAWLAELERLGAQALLNRGTSLEHRGATIWIGGVTDPAAKQAGAEAPDVGKAAAGGENADFKILLSHRPDYAPAAAGAGFQLQLSGHTHGGQFFPWTLVAKLFHRFYIGLMRHESMWIYVSPGSGTWGPPARLGTTPEVTCIRLLRAPLH